MTDTIDNAAPQPQPSLAEVARRVPPGQPAPVERWNPPYCGDIGLKINADGTWHHQGQPIHRSALVRLFATVLRKDDDGRTYLVTPAEKVSVDVADAPFLGVELRVTGLARDQSIAVRTNLDEWVSINADHPLRFVRQPTGGLKPYVRVRGRLDALLVRAVYLELVGLADEGDRSPAGVWSAGVFWAFEAPDTKSP